MAHTTNYTTLVADARSYVERPNDAALLAQIPALLAQAESRLGTDLRILGLHTVIQGGLVANLALLPKPAAWRKTISLRVLVDAEWFTVYLRTFEYCRAYWTTSISSTRPIYYAERDYDFFWLAPPPNVNMAYEIAYVQRLTPLDSVAQENWYTRNAPHLLLAALLLEVELWLKNQNRVAQRMEVYNMALSAFLKEDAARVMDRSVVLM